MSKEERDRSQYQRDYYESHRDALSERRQERYRGDPAYRDEAIRRARDYRARKRQERERLREQGLLPPPRTSGPRTPLRVLVNGEQTVAYTVGRVAQDLGRSKNTLNYWTRIGLLPPTPYRSPRGDRLYTEAMVLVLRFALGRRPRVSARDREFTEEVRRGWEGLGIAGC